MDSYAAGACADATWNDAPALPGPLPAPPAPDASLCMTCPVRSLCIGSMGAEAGTTQLRRVLTRRLRLRRGETVDRDGEHFPSVHVVRSGCLKSVGGHDGERVLGFHFPGELAGSESLARGAQSSTMVALEDSEVCVLRYAPPAPSACLGRLWDMVSRELLRERAQSARLATLPGEQRVGVFLAAVARRRHPRGSASRSWLLALSPVDIGSYLGVAPDTVVGVLSRVAKQGLPEIGWPELG
jgi:CRP/FNR family transcriptional regulator